MVAEPQRRDSTFQDVCIFASRSEQQSHKLYKGLAVQHEGEIAELSEALAKDELRHRNRVEGWYDEVTHQRLSRSRAGLV